MWMVSLNFVYLGVTIAQRDIVLPAILVTNSTPILKLV